MASTTIPIKSQISRGLDRLRWFRDRSAAQSLLPDMDHIGDELSEPYQQYISTVSTPEMAISLELSKFIYGLSCALAPRSILDLGSGFSSFVLRKYASEVDEDVHIVSVDDSPEWLERSRSYVIEQGLDDRNMLSWQQFFESDDASFELGVHDLGDMRTRREAFPTVLGRIDGIVILDDMHKREYSRAVRKLARSAGMEVLSLRGLTLDNLGRFAGVVNGARG